MDMKKKKLIKLGVTAACLIVLYALCIYMDQAITATSRLYMLITVVRKSAVYALVAVSMNLLNGFTGLFSLGQAGFMLIGAYTYAIFSIPSASIDSVYQYYDAAIHFSFQEAINGIFGLEAMAAPGLIIGALIAMLLAGIVAAFFAWLIGLPVLRLKSDYLAIATLGFAEIIKAIFQWQSFGPITNGSNVLRGYTRLSDFTFNIGGTSVSFATFVPVFVASMCILVIVLLINSSYGRAFKAIREDEIAAEAMGVRLFKHKQMAFCISCFFAGVGGALLAMFMNTIQAAQFKSSMTYEILLIVVLGGLGSVTGSCIASFLFIACSEWWLRGLDNGSFLGIESAMFRSGFRLVVFSVIIMVVVLFFRKGIMGQKELPDLFKRRKKAPAAAQAEGGAAK
ncbi:MAG TPA: branched-chain amino acid ABC transporter permease [Candidatus Scatomorpha intestinigallinarum]|jgi:branched-chain amino acid transport system permease protein|uniref:Branched-chain amino acid ABC transporter permease n=2 Tax=Candidatus Scatomorpha intestinigallinarum TaxID=2840923 RepID=A0A9D1DLJ3_9FIRM|nr:branched-chain amino acid ABC transporter permease [Candidatus Scatomorpha intestinigallinarum]